MKRGLVLEGGGMRGMFTCGVLDVMMEEGLTVDGIVGVSAGAAFGVNLKSHQHGRALRYNLRFCNDPRYMGVRSLLRSGDLVNADFAYHRVPTEYDPFDCDTFRLDPAEFHLVTTDVHTGETVYHQLREFGYEALEWIRASASMPVVARPVPLEGRLLLDGGITDSIPLRYFQEQGFSRNIVVLTQPHGFQKTKTRLIPVFKVFLRRYPAITRAMARRHLMYNAQLRYIAEQEALGNTLLIYPDRPLGISRVSSRPAELRAVYQLGRAKALSMLPQLRDFLAQPSC